MKNLKKLASLLLALTMLLCMATTAFAAESQFKITVTNSVSEKTYNAYKVFDATYDNEGHVAYSITETDAWYTLVFAETSPFKMNPTQTAKTYYVTLKEDKTETDVASFFNGISNKNIPGTAAATGAGNGGALVLDVGSAGYYYITTTTGAMVTVTTADPTEDVIDKNQEPGDLTKTVEDAEAQIGDDANYTITANVPAYDGETQIANYTFTDILGSGLTPPEATGVTVQILNASGNAITVEEGKISVNVSGQTITVSYNPTEIEGYPADATIKITYTAVVNTQAAYDNNNTVTQTWTGESTGRSDDADVYTYGFNLVKMDGEGTDAKQLEGATFEMYEADKTTQVKFKLTGAIDTEPAKYTVDPNGNVTEIEVGKALIFGLDADVTYYLKETKAPDGYNILDNLVEVKVGQNGEGENKLYNTTTGINNDDAVVVNKAGTLLPSTGGMGTTLFYVFGGVLVLAAVVLLVTKKRMSVSK